MLEKAWLEKTWLEKAWMWLRQTAREHFPKKSTHLPQGIRQNSD
jgi:hypothetical protein